MGEVMRQFDSARYIEDDLMIATYLKVIMQSDEKDQMLNSLSNALRARTVNLLAKETGIDRESLLKLSWTNYYGYVAYPEINQEMIIKVIKALAEDCTKSGTHQSGNANRFSRWYWHPALWFVTGSIAAILIIIVLA